MDSPENKVRESESNGSLSCSHFKGLFLGNIFRHTDLMGYVYIYIHTQISGWWFGTFFIFPILGRIIPIDFHIFQRGSNHQPDMCIYKYISLFTMGYNMDE